MNIPELKKYLNIFYQISGMEIALLDRQFHQVLSAQCAGNHFCHLIHRYPKCTKLCRESDTAHLDTVSKNRTLLTYTCPFGFYTAIMPVKKDGEIIAYLICSPCVEGQESGNDTAIQMLSSLVAEVDVEIIEKNLDNIPHYSRKTLDAYEELLKIMVDQIEKKNLISDEKESIASLTKRYIDSNLSDKITLTSLSWKLHSSTVTLTEHFRKEYGMSIMTYVLRKRMALAEERLLDPSCSVGDVAQACGFADVEHFSRTFKKYTGMPPSLWRRNENKRQQDTDIPLENRMRGI